MTVEVLTESRCFGGWWTRVRHQSSVCRAAIGISVYQPPRATSVPVPALYWLPGLADLHVERQIRLIASYWLSKLGIAFVIPDARPELESSKNGESATELNWNTAWYVNATQEPFQHHHRMFDYVAEELPEVATNHFPIDAHAMSIAGYANGGLGALSIGLRNADTFCAISAMAPSLVFGISGRPPAELMALLGTDEAQWAAYNPMNNVRSQSSQKTIRIDFGTEGDSYDKEEVERLARGFQSAGQPADIRTHRSYKNDAHLVATFLDQHLEHHALALGVGESKIYDTLGLI